MNYLKKYFAALKENTNDIRKHTIVALGTTLGAIVAGVVLGKANDNRVDVLVIEEQPETRPEMVYTDSTEF